MGLNQSCSVCSLKLEANSFLLGLDNVSPGSGAGLLLQFCVNGVLAGVNLILSDSFQFCLFLVQFLVNFFCPAWSNLGQE